MLLNDELKFCVTGGNTQIKKINDEDGNETEKEIEHIYAVNYNNLFNLNIKATQELIKKVESLELELKNLKDSL